jgi:hypothetical protein
MTLFHVFSKISIWIGLNFLRLGDSATSVRQLAQELLRREVEEASSNTVIASLYLDGA